MFQQFMFLTASAKLLTGLRKSLPGEARDSQKRKRDEQFERFFASNTQKKVFFFSFVCFSKVKKTQSHLGLIEFHVKN